ncbi:MAG TPA: sugar ABC transporter substrate-binding protein, partial [Burkholderiaceae bacterium]
MLKLASSLLAASFLAAASTAALSADQPVIGLITKTDTNPFFVKMKEGASQMAKERGAKLL